MTRLALLVIGFMTLVSSRTQTQDLQDHKSKKPYIPINQYCGANIPSARFHSRHECPAIDLQAYSENSGFGLWTHQPYCNHRNYCVFTNSLFHKHRGISIITTPENLANTPNLLDVLFTVPTPREPDPAAYEVIAIPDKGIGVRATRRIRRYEIVMTDSVRVFVDSAMPGRMKHAEGLELLSVAMEQLPEPEILLDLARSSKNLSASIPDDIMKTNAFGLSFSQTSGTAVFPKIARINHACDPNAGLRWTNEALENAIVALRDIEPGEEISISYTVFGMMHAARQKALLSRWGFQCSCSLCSASPAEIELSDKRRERLRQLRDEVRTLIGKQLYKTAIDVQHEFIKLSEVEGLTSQIGEYYWVLSRLYSIAGDRASSVKYAKVAHAELKRYREGGTALDDIFDDLEHFLAQNR